jgi:hypothetical protein
MRDKGADEGPAGEADRHSEIIDRHRPRAPFGREIVGDQSDSGRHSARFADADPDAVEKQLPEAAGDPAQRREAAPHGQRSRDHRASAGLVREVSERDSKRGIEQCERHAADRTELRVAEMQVRLDRLSEDSQHLPVEEVQDVSEEEEREDQ